MKTAVRLCKKGLHNLDEVGVYKRNVCKACKREYATQRRKNVGSTRTRPSYMCGKNLHDKRVTGVNANGQCIACRKAWDKDRHSYKRVMKANLCRNGHDKKIHGKMGNDGYLRCTICIEKIWRKRDKLRKITNAPQVSYTQLIDIPRLKRERLKFNLSQREMANLCGVSRSTISQIEQGISKAKPGTAAKILEAVARLYGQRDKYAA